MYLVVKDHNNWSEKLKNHVKTHFFVVLLQQIVFLWFQLKKYEFFVCRIIIYNYGEFIT